MEERKKERKKDTDYKTGGNVSVYLDDVRSLETRKRESFEEWEERMRMEGWFFTVGWRGCGNFYPFGG